MCAGVLVFALLGLVPAHAQVALVIDNGAYRSLPALINPRNAAEDVGKALAGLDFATIVVAEAPVETKQVATEEITPPPGPLVSSAALYEEDPNDPKGRVAAGTAIWTTEMLPAGNGKPPELAVRADIEIPGRKINLTWTLRRDTDQDGAASHIIEIKFKLPPDFPSGGILDVPGVLMKQGEQTRGTALKGLAIKVTTGYFLFGLSAKDKLANLQLLKEGSWFDIPIVYTDNRRAILAMKKDTAGERAFEQAFAEWEK
jgi:hypothetical protein